MRQSSSSFVPKKQGANVEDRPLRCVSWVAVSSKAQADKESPDEQRRKNAEVITRLGGEMVAELYVPGQSRDIVEFQEAEREIEAYGQLRAMLDSRAIDLLVFRDMSRLGRTAALGLQVAEMCHRAGVALYNRASPPSSLNVHDQRQSDAGLVVQSIEGAFAQIEIRNLRRRHRLGMTGRVRSGKLPNNTPYGYRKTFRPDGSAIVEPDPDQALVVQEIVEMFLQGMSYRDISNVLNDRGIEAPGSATWHATTPRKILMRAWTYAGFSVITWGDTGEQVKAEGEHDAIITVTQAKQVLKEISDRWQGISRNGSQLFSRVVQCETCGRYYTSQGVRTRADGTEVRYWKCDGRVTGHTGSAVIEPSLMAALNEAVDYLRNTGALREAIRATQPKKARDVQPRMDQLELALIQVNRQRDKLIYMGQRDIVSIEEVEERIRPMDARKKELELAIAELQANLEDEETEQERYVRIKYVLDHWTGILDRMSQEQANLMLRSTFRIIAGKGGVKRVRLL
jgi:DNA invertase Pin-like site-specific DNA recombinase